MPPERGGLTVDNEVFIALRDHAVLMARNRAEAQIALARDGAAHDLPSLSTRLNLTAVARAVTHWNDSAHDAPNRE